MGFDKMWTDLEGWAVPGEANKDRCSLFQSGCFKKNGIALKYRYFKAVSEKKLPLVVFLHGADAMGDDNESQLSLHDVGTIFAEYSWQAKHPCHIVAPQFCRGKHWAKPSVRDVLQAFVEDMAECMDADKERIYIYGYSAGAIGIYELLKKYPDYYAAAVPVCGSTMKQDLQQLSETPMWLFHAEDDMIVRAETTELNFGNAIHLGSKSLYQELKKFPEAEVYYTEFKEGDMMGKYGLHPHCSWVLMGRDEEVKEWLFSKRRIETKS